METNKKLINEEIHRIREMMGLYLINEGFGGLLDELVSIFKKTPNAANEVSDIAKINKGNIRTTVLGLATKNKKMFKLVMDELINKLDTQLKSELEEVFKYIPTSKSKGYDYKTFEQEYEKILESQGVQNEVIDLFKKDLEIKWNEAIPTKSIAQTMSTENLVNMFDESLKNKSIKIDENNGFVIDREPLFANIKIRTGASDNAINEQLDLLEKAMPKTDAECRTIMDAIAERLNVKVNTSKITKKTFFTILKELYKYNWGIKLIAGLMAFFATNQLSQLILWMFGQEESGVYLMLELLSLEPGSIERLRDRLSGKKETEKNKSEEKKSEEKKSEEGEDNWAEKL